MTGRHTAASRDAKGPFDDFLLPFAFFIETVTQVTHPTMNRHPICELLGTDKPLDRSAPASTLRPFRLEGSVRSEPLTV